MMKCVSNLILFGFLLFAIYSRSLSVSALSGEEDDEILTSANPTSFDSDNCLSNKISHIGRILGGEETLLGDFPWMARILYRNKFNALNFGCGGSLITPRYVLTAAHCIDMEEKTIAFLGNLDEVHLGMQDSKAEIECDDDGHCADPPQKIKVQNAFVNPSYDRQSPQSHNDIGLIRLLESAVLSDYVQTACLWNNGELTPPASLWVSGWGATENAMFSTKKLKIKIPFVDMETCSQIWGREQLIVTEDQICAGGEKNVDSCTGDSGGPLMVENQGRFFVIGLVSYGAQKCGYEGIPAIHTKVSSYIDWIEENLV